MFYHTHKISNWCTLRGRQTRISPSHALLTLAFVLLLSLAEPSFAKQGNNQDWVGSWGASPQSAVEPIFGPPPLPDLFDNQTIRMVARISKGGDGLRVRFDNSYASESLTIGAAHVALHQGGGTTAADSDRALSFGGLASITIPAGGVAMSDSADLQLDDLSEVAVSLYLPTATSGTSVHSVGLQTTYVSPSGNFSDAQNFPTQYMALSRYFLSGIDVRTEKNSRAIVTLGDSITDGFASTVDANNRWPDRLAEHLLSNARTRKLGVVNAGINGNRVLNNVIGPAALARLDRDVLAVSGAAYLTILEGINDIGLGLFFPSQVVSAEQIIQGYRQIIDRAHAQCLKVIGATLTPFEGALYHTPEGEAKRQVVNAFIRDSDEFDAIIDFDLATRDPNHPTRFLAAYDSGDNLHPSDAGYDAMAASIDLRIFKKRLKNCSVTN